MACAGARGVYCFRVAELPLVDSVVRRDVMDLWCRFDLRLGGVGHCRQHFIVDLDLLGGILRLGQRFSDNDGNRIADIVCLAVGKRRMRRNDDWLDGIDDRDARQLPDAVGREIGFGENRHYSGDRARRL